MLDVSVVVQQNDVGPRSEIKMAARRKAAIFLCQQVHEDPDIASVWIATKVRRIAEDSTSAAVSKAALNVNVQQYNMAMYRSPIAITVLSPTPYVLCSIVLVMVFTSDAL